MYVLNTFRAVVLRRKLPWAIRHCVPMGVRLATGLVLLIGPISACGSESLLNLIEGDRPTLGSEIRPSGTPHVEAGDNHVLEMAQLVYAGDEPQLIRGTISSSGDVDVYDLGPVSAGDRVRVEVDASGGLLGAIGLFDDTGATLLINDHRNVYLGRQGPFVDVVMRRASASCLVAMAATPGFDTSGGYELAAAIEFPFSVPRPRPDVFVLDFDGARSAKIGTRSAVPVPAFDASRISSRFEGLSPLIIEEIVARVRAHFEGFDVTILSTSESTSAGDSASRVYFGTYDSALLGVADGVDEYNATSNQHAIVFTDTFEVFESQRPSVAEISQAIANVASHEIGHLLGLIHTKDPVDIMDVTASLRQLQERQFFGRAPIHSGVFPLGEQDSVQMLLDSVGGDEVVARSVASLAEAETKYSVVQKINEPPARLAGPLGGCGLHE